MNWSFVGKTLEYLGKKDFKRSEAHVVNKQTDNLLISGRADNQSFQEFENVAFQNYQNNKIIRIYAHEYQRENILNSDIVYEDAVEFLEPQSASSQAIKVLGDSALGERSIFVTDKTYKEELRSWVKALNNTIAIYED